MLPGANIRNVFASRWKALYWSLGVMLTAYCTIPAAEPKAADPAKVAQADAAKAHHAQKNEWSKDGSWPDERRIAHKSSSALSAGYFSDDAVKLREKLK